MADEELVRVRHHGPVAEVTLYSPHNRNALSRALVEQLNDGPARQAVLAERALLRALGGGCQVPIGAAAKVDAGALTLRGVVLGPDGTRRVYAEAAGLAAEAEAIGRRLAEELLARGARELLQV